MSVHLKQFEAAGNSAFSKMRVNAKDGSVIAAGNLGGAACLISTDSNGTLLDQWKYGSTDFPIAFSGLIEVADGYLALGTRKLNETRGQTLVVSLDPKGKIRWSKIYRGPTTWKPLGMLPVFQGIIKNPYPDQVIIVSRNTTETGLTDIELIKINREGTVLASKVLALQLDKNSTVNLASFAGGGALYGGTNEANGYKGFIVGFDLNLTVNFRKLLAGAFKQELLSIAPAGNQYVAAGVAQIVKRVSGKKIFVAVFYSFIFKFDTKTTGVEARGYDLLPGPDAGTRVLLPDTNKSPGFYLLASQDEGSVTARFDAQLALQWVKRLDIPNRYSIADASFFAANNELVLCGFTEKNGQQYPLSGRTDKEFGSCLTLENAKPAPVPLSFEMPDWVVPEKTFQPAVNDLDLQVITDPIFARFLCPASTINLSGMIQSPYLYLQAAGSDAADNSAKGNQLRWRFQKSLGDTHLAKGDYTNASSPYYTTIGFNKPGDFVKIYRAPYLEKYETRLQFRDTLLPAIETKTGATRSWQFNNVALTFGAGANTVLIRFNDLAQYDAIRAGMTALKPESLIKQYKGVLEIEVQNKLCFSARYSIAYTGAPASAYLRAEAISCDDPADPTTAFVACRKKFQGPAQLNDTRIVGENLKYIRLDYSVAYVSEIFLETYSDFIANTGAMPAGRNWEFLNDFALTLDTTTAFERLENQNSLFVPNSKKYAIDKQWDKYNDANAATGAFKVRVDNYKHRWYPAPNAEHPETKAANGIQKAIEEYLTLSKTDPKAVKAIPVEDDPDNEAKMDVSFFDITRFVSLDYHVARMMGLGHIDADIPNPNAAFVYLMAYTSKGALEATDPPGLMRDHLYMSLPTTQKDYRLPAAPRQLPVTYGMTTDIGFGVMNTLTDAQGYVPFDTLRFVNINRDVYPYEKTFGNFFDDPLEFDLSKETIPVKYGIEYREQSESVFRKPEITQDEEYFDLAGFNEPVEIPEQGKKTLYIHREREEGIHCYALYAISWFSRISPLSNLEYTDYTRFQKVKSLLPPSNFAVQLIQPENEPMLTTSKEQAALAGMTGPDKTLLRATFDWNHNHNVNYPFAERAQLFYRETAPDSIRGEVAAVIQLPNNQVKVQVKSFQILSTSPAETVSPAIPAGQEQKYIGSLFACGQQAYIIDAINNSGALPEFVLNQVRQTESADPLLNNQIVTLIDWLKPAAGERFTVAENTSVETNWSTRLQRTVYLEKFHNNSVIRIENSGTANNGVYRLERVTRVGNATALALLDPLHSPVVAGSVRYEIAYRLIAFDTVSKKLSISGNVGSSFPTGSTIRLFGSSYLNDGEYTVAGMPIYNNNTGISVIAIAGAIADPGANFGYVAVQKTAAIVGIDRKAKTVFVQGILTAVIIPPYVESRLERDQKTWTKLVYGGIFQSATVSRRANELEVYDLETNLPVIDPNTHLPKVVQDHIGAYTVIFNNNFALPSHIDPSVEWHKGVLRISDTQNTSSMKSLPVWEIVRDTNGKIKTPLELIVFDPDFNPKNQVDLIQLGANLPVNFHPSYRVYLKAEFNASNAPDATHQFNAASILPAVGEGSKMTYMGIRSIDRFKQPPANNVVQYDSYIAPQVPVLAREIVTPELVEISGPLFATRPDYYGKSSYTIDLKLNTASGRIPYAILAYRGSETQVLGTLYSEGTLDGLLTAIQTFKAENPAAYYDLLNKLVNVVVDANGHFTTNSILNFAFPLPDNPDYIIPNRDRDIRVKGFLTDTTPAYTIPILGPQKNVVKQAILDTFLSLTEQPVVYKYVKGGYTTSGKKPVFRDSNGDLVTPVLPDTSGYNPNLYDPHPMAVKFAKSHGSYLLPADSGYSNQNNEFYIRFTDYTLDGASREIYFYYACEITNRMELTPIEYIQVKAPVLLVNSAPPEPPGIREVRTILADPLTNTPSAVHFDLNPYNETEGITQFWIYRAYDAADASNIRTMMPPDPARKIDVGAEVIDTFSDLAFPPYGETLFYRIVAVRRILNELSQQEDILSLPSKLVQTGIVDLFNPQPPKLFAQNGTSTAAALKNVILKWKPTAYNGAYYLQKLNNSGNWVELYRTKTKDGAMQYPPLNTSNKPDFTNFGKTQSLPRIDADGNAVYHRYRVQVENASGLFNLSEFELTLAKGAFDLQEMDSMLQYADANNHLLPQLTSTAIVAGASQPDQMVFTHRDEPLPAGHNSLIQIDISVSDDLGHSALKTIGTPGGNAVFQHGDGGLVLDASNPNRTYTVRTKTFTNFAPTGAVQVFTLDYLAGPAYDLQNNKDLVLLTDNTHEFNPARLSQINDGVAYPMQLKFKTGSGLTDIGQTLVQMDITVADNKGNSATKTINSGTPTALFDGNDGLQADSSNANGDYEISLKIFTAECPAGIEQHYRIFYTHTPYDDLAGLKDLVQFTDNNVKPSVATLVPVTGIKGNLYPKGRITIQELIAAQLPSGHQFQGMDVMLEDGMGGQFTRRIQNAGGTAVFNHGDGNLNLSDFNPNRGCLLTVTLFTNLCPDGVVFGYRVKYLG